MSTSHSRRRFLKSTLCYSALGLGVFGMSRSALGAEPYGSFRMGLQSYSLRNFTFAEALDKIAELGLKHVELYPGHLDHNKVSSAELADAKKLMADKGITPDAYGVVGFTNDEAAARKVFEFAKALGLRAISADPSENSFDMLDKLVEEYEIPIAIHNHGPKHHWGKPEVILAAVKDHNKRIGLCADTGHFLRADVDPIEAIRLLKGRVYGIHVKDFVSESEEVIAGDGKLDMPGLFKELAAQQFDGACSVEYELNPEDPMEGIRQGLSNAQAAIASLGSA